MVSRLRREFQEALVTVRRREAFELLVEAWSAELGAMSFAESLKLLDLLFLVFVVDNRSHLEGLRGDLQNLDEKTVRIEELLEWA